MIIRQRTVTDVQLFVLYLNKVIDHIEDMTAVAISTDYDKLVSWYNEQKAPEKYRDEEDHVRNMIGNPIYKTFKRGSLLEYYNPCPTTTLIEGRPTQYYGGICSQWFPEDKARALLRAGSCGELHVVCSD